MLRGENVLRGEGACRQSSLGSQPTAMWNDSKHTLTRPSPEERKPKESVPIGPELVHPESFDLESGQLTSAAVRPVEQQFVEGCPQFLTELQKLRDPAVAARLADRWAQDDRPWARMQLLAYLDAPLSCPGHQPLVKRLYRAAEQRGDMELVGAFLVAFDRLVTHARRSAPDGDIRLSALQNVIPSFRRRKSDDTWHDHRSKVPLPHRGRLFTYRTRYYLRRRAWRTLRRFASRNPEHYPAVATAVLARYTDDDLATGECVLDRWGLLQIAYRHSAALSFGRHTVRLQPAKRMSSLMPAPSLLPLWQMPAAGDALLRLMVEGRSHLVRRWAHQLLLAEHGPWLRNLSPLCWLPLLDHARPEIAAFAFEGLQASNVLPRLPIDECLPLLETRHRAARQCVREVVIDRIGRGELAAADLVTLCCQRNRDVVSAAWSRLQFEVDEEKKPLDTAQVALLANVRCHRFAGSIAAWAIQWLVQRHSEGVCQDVPAETSPAETDMEQALLRFFEHPLPAVRQAACQWWVATSVDQADPRLWSKLCDIEHADVQKALLAWLERYVGDSLLGPTQMLPHALVEPAWRLWEAALRRLTASVRMLELAINQAAVCMVHQMAAGMVPREPIIARLAELTRAGSDAVAGRALAALVQIAASGEPARALIEALLPSLQWDESG